MKNVQPQAVRRHRRGTLLPLLALSILVVSAAGALVLDRLWINAAQVQLNAAAEAAALAAARQLACDERLKPAPNENVPFEKAVAAADHIARANFVAGHPVELDLSTDGDICFGQIVENPATGSETFLETRSDPTTVRVVAQSLKQRGSGLQLFFQGVTGQQTGNARAIAQGTIENRVTGIRPLVAAAAPCLPLGILGHDLSGMRQDTWQRQIELGQGQDRYGYDDEHQTTLFEPDGIPEIVLRITDDANARLLDLGTDLSRRRLQQQIDHGITGKDLTTFGGELLFDAGPIDVDGSARLISDLQEALLRQIGRPRIVLLYQANSQESDADVRQTRTTGLVAIRLLEVRREESGFLQFIAQPTVIATRAAVLSNRADSIPNPCVYKLYRTR